MENEKILSCPQCSAVWQDGQTCESYFHQLGFWEFTEPQTRFAVHPLMVLSYHLQHPALYSKEGLQQGILLLKEFLEQGTPPDEIRKRSQKFFNSKQRSWSIRGSDLSRGSYPHPITWPMTIADVVAAAEEAYVEQVRKWAASINQTLAMQSPFN
jgi:hypothetical protein